ncbi:MAG: SpoIIIAH-like family protein [Bacillota bacterium]|nr:SpoIIIAH-like family protein [Bacillota bacterium]
MKDRVRSGFALMVVIAVVLGVLIGTRNVQAPLEKRIDLAADGDAQPAATGSGGAASGGPPAATHAGPGTEVQSQTQAGTATPTPAQTPPTQRAATAPTGNGATMAGADVTGEDFFSQYRLERSRARSRNIELLRQIIADERASEEARAAASTQLVDLSKKSEAEAEAEALICARGYKDALVFVRGDTCDVVVSGPELTRFDAEQIGDIVARCLGLELANITIIERGD